MRKLMWFTLGFAAVCAFCAYLQVTDLAIPAVFAAVLFLLFVIGSRWIKHFRIGAVLCLGIALGLGWFQHYDLNILRDARVMNDETVYTSILALDYSYKTDYGCALDGEITLGENRYKVRVYLESYQDIAPGNRLVGQFRLKTKVAEGEDITFHRGQGVFLTVSPKGNVVIERFYSTPWRLYPMLAAKGLENRIQSVFPEDGAGFIQALLLGDRSGIDYATSTAFKISGISHIIAVSGLHVSILIALVYLVTARKRWLSALIGVPVVLFFAAIVGFSPSVTRAAIMQILIMVAMLFDKEYDPPTALSFAALVQLIVNPLVITSVSFQLSFACMAGIICWNQPIMAWLMDGRRLGIFSGKWVRWFASGIALSVSASLFTTPLVAIHFGTISLVSIITNLLTIWAMSFIFYGALLACLVGCIHIGAGSLVAWVVTWLVRYVLAVAKVIARFPLAAVYTKSPYILAWLILGYILLGLFFCLRKKPAVYMTLIATLCLMLCIMFSWAEPLMDDYRITMLDVGQGQAILLQSGGNVYLVDCGGDYDENAADAVSETLLSQGVRRIDGIILTHYDGDHAGGVSYLLTRVETDWIFLPHSYDPGGVGSSIDQMTDAEVIRVKEDTILSFGDASIQLFAPISYNSGNESSMSVLFQRENCAILITGDMGEDGERLLMKYHDLPDVDVLVAGHHGSKYSTSQALLDAVKPEYVLISVGENRYGHPAQIILDRLAAMGCIVYRTDEDGTIIFRG